MSRFEVIRGVEGCCLALDDTRIAGPKPWGGGKVIHAWETDKTYTAVDVNSRWFELFGTPRRAAKTMARMCLNSEHCENCPLFDAGLEHCERDDSDVPGIEFWLRAEAVKR